MADVALVPPKRSLWTRLVDLVERYLDLGPRIIDHMLGATRDETTGLPSSSRIYGGMIVPTVLLQMHIIRTTNPIGRSAHRGLTVGSFFQ
jgi:hypothetical protein